MGIQSAKERGKLLPPPFPPLDLKEKKRKEKQILNHKKYVNKITTT